MEAFFTIIGTGTLLVVFAILSVLFGAESRDGFAEGDLGRTGR